MGIPYLHLANISEERYSLLTSCEYAKAWKNSIDEIKGCPLLNA